MKTLIKNIGLLYGIQPVGAQPLRGEALNSVEALSGAWLLAADGLIAGFGTMDACPADNSCDLVIDARGAIVAPAFCDSHTHIVYAGSRQGEFVDKINGLTYEQIAARGGGILNSADLLAVTSEDELYHDARRRLMEAAATGTGAIEIKTGYGLSLESELKMLRVIDRLRRDVPGMEIRATFLGAHAVGRAFAGRQDEYVRHIIDVMLPEVARTGIADFVDVFCDRGFFTSDQTADILRAAAPLGLRPKIHADELARSGGTQTGVAFGALSVDHLERAGAEEFALLASSSTVATMLPGASFFLGMPYGDARAAVTAGCILALASDRNPGSSPSGSMPFVMSLGCIKMRLRPAEAFNAVTFNGAVAMGVETTHGSVTPGKAASLIIYKNYFSDPAYIPYAYTEPLIRTVLLRGEPTAASSCGA